MNAIRRSINKDTSYGTDAWRDKMVVQFKLQSTLRRKGRPKKK